MTPAAYLLLIVAITVAMALGWRIVRFVRRRRMRRAAAAWQLRYCPADQFRLARRLAGEFPIVGAADFYVLDLMYGGDTAVYRYLCTVEYTLGLTRHKQRHRRVIQLIEPRGPGQSDLQIQIAPTDRPLLEQYRYFQ